MSTADETVRYRAAAHLRGGVVVPVELGETFRALEPRALFSDNGYNRSFPTRDFDVHPNGDTFVMVQRSFGGALQLVVVIGWLEEVRGRATGQ